ncbi:MAG: hypothetical protein QOE31_52, partial [Solirubrobacteraceae bacterium]|nr:hypothetical protein [Solirubrobacteraceae bacterium]
MRSARSRSQSTGRYGAAVVIALVALLAIVSAAPGYWSGGDEVDGTGAAVAATVLQGAAPTASEAGSGNVVVDWGNSGLSNGVPADGYIVRRYATVTGFSAAVGAGCAGTRTTTVCTETGTPPGDWQYTVTPVFADNWRGAESVASGDVDTGPGTMTLARLAFGGTVAPLPVSVAGTVAGFAPNGAISYTLDDIAPLTGSPTHVGASGTAAITLTIPAGIGDGPHTISVVGASAEASVGIVVDTTAPSITLFTTPAPNAAGWNNTSPVEVNGTVDDGSGSGLAFGKYTTDGSDPKTSPTSQFAVAPLSITETSTLKFYLADVAGNESAVETLPVKIDTTPPYFTVAFVDVTGGVYLGPTNVGYYRGADAGSLRFEMTPIPMGGSTVISAGFSAMPPDAFGFSFDSSAVTTPAGGPFVGNPVSWEAGTASNPSGTVTLTDEAGNTFGGSGPLLNDSTAPAGGHADATGLVGTGGRYSTSLTIGLDLAKGADAQSGLADGSGQSDVPARLMRASAALTSDGVANGSCGIYGAFAQVGGNDPLSSVEDTVPDDRTCYRYRYLVSDHVGNVATYVTPDIKVQTGPSALLRPTDATLTAVSGIAAQVVSGSTVFYNPAQSGSFDVNTTSSAPYAGVSALGFPAIAGFSGGGTVTAPISGTTYRGTYAWSANEASPSPGVQSISATNNIGQTATNSTAFSVVRDDSGPSGGSVDATGLGGTGGRYSTSMTLSVLLARGSDAGAGLATSGAQLLRASAALTSDGTASGGCGTFGPYNEVGADDPASPRSDTVPVDRICYRYHYVVSDGVGNDTTYSSGDVKVDATAPPVPGLGFSALDNAYWSGTGSAIFYRPGAASGAFKVTATSVDTTAGTSAIDFPILPAGWTSSAGGLGIGTYAWSAPNPTAPVGAQTVTASNYAGRSSSSTFTATADPDAPAGGNVSYASGYTGASTISVAFAAGTDAGSGLDAASAVLQRSRAALANGTCGTFDAFATVASAPTTPNSDGISAGNCYQYRYRVADNVGNVATYTSAGVVKV